MNIDEAIAALEAIKAERGGETELAAWEYGGGLEYLQNVEMRYSADLDVVVVISTDQHSSMAER